MDAGRLWDNMDFAGLNSAVLNSFGEDAVYQDAGQGQTAMRVILSEPDLWEDKPAGEFMNAFILGTALPTLPIKSGNLTVLGTKYTIWKVQVDQAGGIKLGLKRSQ